MVNRKFNLDIPLLKIGTSRPDPRLWKDMHSSSFDSRPPTPKSVRPPLPNAVEAELRAACAYVVKYPKPSHEQWLEDVAKPALDYLAIQRSLDLAQGGHVKKASTHSNDSTHSNNTLLRHDADPKYSYRPAARAEELFRRDSRKQPAPTNGRSRVDHLMAPEPAKNVAAVSIRPRATSQSQSSQQQQLAPASKSNGQRISTRSDSVGTVVSTPYTDSTDYPWSAYTPMTSAGFTPARESNRASSQNATSTSECSSVPKVDALNAEWMRTELEKHKKVMEGREKEKEGNREGKSRAHIVTLSRTQTSKIPARKPVPSRPDSRQTPDMTRSKTHREDGHERRDRTQSLERGRGGNAHTTSQDTAEMDARGREPTRSSSKLGKASRAASRVAGRAASKAGSITAHYLRSGSVRQAHAAASAMERAGSPRRTRSFSAHVKDHFRSSRPGTATGSGKPSVDIHTARPGSRDSLHSTASGMARSERSFKWRVFRGRNDSTADASDPNSSRPGSAKDNGRSPSQREKPPVDLNRELPPLPSLDQWKAAEPLFHDTSFSWNATNSAGDGMERVMIKDTSSLAALPNVASTSGIGISRQGPQVSRPQKSSPNFNRSEQSQHLAPNQNEGPASKHAKPTGLRVRSKNDQSSQPELDIPSNQTHSNSSHPQVKLVHVTGSPDGRSSRATTQTPINGNKRSKSLTSSHTQYSRSRDNSHGPKPDSKYKLAAHSRADLRSDAQQDPSQVKDSPKRRWWQVRERKQASWEDQVAQSGARNGTFAPNDLPAEGPIVRF